MLSFTQLQASWRYKSILQSVLEWWPDHKTGYALRISYLVIVPTTAYPQSHPLLMNRWHWQMMHGLDIVHCNHTHTNTHTYAPMHAHTHTSTPLGFIILVLQDSLHLSGMGEWAHQTTEEQPCSLHWDREIAQRHEKKSKEERIAYIACHLYARLLSQKRWFPIRPCPFMLDSALSSLDLLRCHHL